MGEMIRLRGLLMEYHWVKTEKIGNSSWISVFNLWKLADIFVILTWKLDDVAFLITDSPPNNFTTYA